MRDKFFYSICLGFVIGVLLRSFFFLNIFVFLFFAILSLVLFFYFNFLSVNKKIAFVFLFLPFLFLGILHFNSLERKYPLYLEENTGERILLDALLVDEMVEGEFNIKTIALVKNEKDKTKILLTLPFGSDYKYGDRVLINGILEKPENFTTPQGKEFDYISYLKKDNILYIIKKPDIELISRNNGFFLKRFLFSFKEKFLSILSFSIPSPENLLMGGLILGERASFGEVMRQKFIDTGTIHIVALSGYNVTIVAEWIISFFKFLPNIFSFYFGILGVILFILMSGASATGVRAGIMAILALFARMKGLNYEVGRGLILAGVFMILFNPYILVYDVSFQLSFIATFAVIFIAPKMEKYFRWVTTRFGLRDIFAVTFSAYIFVLPFVVYKMGNLSLVSLPANILILPFIPLTMVLGFLTGFVGLFWKMLALPTGFLSFVLLKYELWIIEIFSKFPLASLTIPSMPIWVMILCYFLFLYFYLKNKD